MATKSSIHNLTRNKLIEPIIPKVPNYSNYHELHKLDEAVINDPNFYKYSAASNFIPANVTVDFLFLTAFAFCIIS